MEQQSSWMDGNSLMAVLPLVLYPSWVCGNSLMTGLTLVSRSPLGLLVTRQ